MVFERLVCSQWKMPSVTLIGKIRHNENYLCLSYGKVIVNEVEEDVPRVWDTVPYSRYYTGEDRRKRSEKSATALPSTTLQPPTSSFQTRRLPSLLPTPQPV